MGEQQVSDVLAFRALRMKYYVKLLGLSALHINEMFWQLYISKSFT